MNIANLSIKKVSDATELNPVDGYYVSSIVDALKDDEEAIRKFTKFLNGDSEDPDYVHPGRTLIANKGKQVLRADDWKEFVDTYTSL